MKTVNAILKVVAALAAVAGTVYVVATYGDQIVAWAKKVLASLPKCPCCDHVVVEAEEPMEETPVEDPAEAPVEEPAVEEAPVEEAPAEEIPAPAPNEPVAEENDFAE